MLWSPVILFVICLLLSSSCGQIYNASTIPAVGEGTFPIVSAVEDAENITFFCEVFRISDGVQFLTQWSLIRDSDTVFFLFTLEGNGQENFENMMVTTTAEFRSNLTIFVFNSSFDNTQIGCGQGNEVASRFNLRIISELI